MTGYGVASVAYLLADRTATRSYTPTSVCRYAKAAGTPAILRTATGRWRIRLPSMPVGGAAVVTPYGTAARQCQVAGIVTHGTPQVLAVRCFDHTGTPADAAFMLAYER